MLALPFRNPLVSAAAALAVGLALAASAALWQARDNAAFTERRFDELSQRAAGQVAARLRSYEYGLRGARGAAIAAGTQAIDRLRYRLYSESRDIDVEFPGARGIGIIKRVPATGEAAFAAAARRDGWPDFAVRQLQPHDDERFVIQYIEPVERNRQAVGLDIASEPRRRAAALAAMRNGQATITAPIGIVQAAGKGNRSFLLLLPIYQGGETPADAAQREVRTVGWAYAPLVIDEVLRGLDLRGGEFALHLRDVSTDVPAEEFYVSPGSEAAAGGSLDRRVRFALYGREWEAEVRALPAFAANLNLPDPRLTAAAGSGVAALLALLVLLAGQSARRAVEVRREQTRRAAIVEGSSDAIIGEALDGTVLDWNRGAERLFGYTREQAIGRLTASLLLPIGQEAEDAELRAAMKRGETLRPFDAKRRTQSGELLDVSVVVSPIVDAEGRIVALSKTLRDISEAKRVERQVRELNATLERQVLERTAMLDGARRDLQQIVDAVPSVIGYCDAGLRVRFANRACEAWFGLGAQRLLGMSMREVLGPRYESGLPVMQAALRGEPQSFEREIPLPDGSGVRHALGQYLPDVVDGEVRGFYVIMHDVSQQTEDRARLATALRENEALLSTIRLHAIFSVANRAGTIIEANDNFCRITGYAREELLGQNHRIVNSGVQDRAFWVDMWRSIASGQPWRGEVCNRAKDGSLYWVDSIIAPFVGADGRIEKYISIRTDITAAKLAEQQLRRKNELVSTIIESLPCGLSVFDDQLKLVASNREYRKLLDFPDALFQAEQPRFEDFIRYNARRGEYGDGDVETLVKGIVDRARSPAVPHRFERIRGNGMPLEVQGAPMPGGGFVTTYTDVSERKRAEALLQLAHDRFAIAADSADIGVWEWDTIANTLTWDDRMYRLYGRERTAGAEPYSLWAESLHPDDRAATEAALNDALAGRRDYAPEFRIVRPGGEVRHLKANARVIRDAKGRPLRMTGVNIDITDRKRAELELRETSSLLGTVLESASEVSVIATTPDFTIKVFNRGAERMLGYRADEMIGKLTPGAIHDPAEMAAYSRELTAELGHPVEGSAVFTEASTHGVAREWTYVRKDGRRIKVSLVVTAMRGDDGELLGYLGVAHDVTLQKQQEATLRQAMHKARHANLAKSQFLANMSHEIRTPMNAVIGLSYLLGQTELSAEQADFLAKIKLASKSLLALINDILDLSKVEAGELRVESAPFKLRHIIRDLTDVMTVHAQAKRIALEVDAPHELPVALQGDSVRLGQVLTNLLANAIKFTEAGRVALVVRQVSGDDARVRLRFSVKDSGIGITPEVQARLFTPFVQADTSMTRRFGGTGLGLSIVKRLVDLMGGEVSLNSTPGVGSEFHVELEFDTAAPDAPAPQPPALRPGQRGLPGLRVLVADDSDLNLEVARRILELEGAVVTLAADGQQACERLRDAPGDYDVVLMDVQMPVLDGYKATRFIRFDLGLTDLPIIALTAGALTSERQHASEAGMNDFVSKPFEPASLVRVILRHCTARSAGRMLPAGIPPAPLVRDEAATADGWPAVAGIDTATARQRLCDDVELFISSLQRFLRDYVDVAMPAPTDGPAELQQAAARLHKLRGVAGLLAAQGVHRCAGAAEAACRDGQAARAARLGSRLAQRLHRLRAAAAPVLAALAGDTAGAPTQPVATAEAPDAAAVEDLLSLLRRRDLAALERFADLERPLASVMEPVAHADLRTAIDDLRFDAAAQMLEASLGAPV